MHGGWAAGTNNLRGLEDCLWGSISFFRTVDGYVNAAEGVITGGMRKHFQFLYVHLYRVGEHA